MRANKVRDLMEKHNCNFSYETVAGRLKRGWSEERALTEEPVLKSYRLCYECNTVLYSNSNECFACKAPTPIRAHRSMRGWLNER